MVAKRPTGHSLRMNSKFAHTHGSGVTCSEKICRYSGGAVDMKSVLLRVRIVFSYK